MIRSFYFALFSISVFCFSACRKPNEIIETQKSCINAILERTNFTPYDGRKLGCFFIIQRCTWRSDTYFSISNPCMDMTPIFVDCEGNQICYNGIGEDCSAFSFEVEYFEIVAFKE